MSLRSVSGVKSSERTEAQLRPWVRHVLRALALGGGVDAVVKGRLLTYCALLATNLTNIYSQIYVSDLHTRERHIRTHSAKEHTHICM